MGGGIKYGPFFRINLILLFVSLFASSVSHGRNFNIAELQLLTLALRGGLDLGEVSPFGRVNLFRRYPYTFPRFLRIGPSHIAGGPLDPPSGGSYSSGYPSFARGFSGFDSTFGYGETTQARPRSTTLEGGSICGDQPYAAFCADALREKGAVDQQVEIETNDALRKFLAKSGNSYITYASRMAWIASTRSVPEHWKGWYRDLLQSTEPPLDVKSYGEGLKSTFLEGLKASGFRGDMEKASKTIRDARIVTGASLDLENPTEVSHFIATCGAGNRMNNAYTCPFHDTPPILIFICGPRIRAALARAHGDTALALADMTHTFHHEFGHGIGSEPGSPFVAALSPLGSCLEWQNGKSASSDHNVEKVADHHGAWGVAKLIEAGATLGLPAAKFAKVAMARLCGTGGSDHPPDYQRMKEFMQVLRLNEGSRNPLMCSNLPPSERMCTEQGLI